MKEILVVTLLWEAALVSLLASHFSLPKSYLFPLHLYPWAIGLLWILTATSLLAESLAAKGDKPTGKEWNETSGGAAPTEAAGAAAEWTGKLSLLFSFLLTTVTLYSLVEFLYASFPMSLPRWIPLPSEVIENLNGYFFHRSHQYLVVSILLLLFFRKPQSIQTSFLKWGDLRREARLVSSPPLSGRQTRSQASDTGLRASVTWRAFLIRLMVLIAMVTALLRLLRSHGWGSPAILFCNLLGAVNNSAIEELLFRGIFLSVAAPLFGPLWGNLFQALSFGLLHQALSPVQYLAQAGTLAFLGWLFGRATLETGGIGWSFLLHSTLVAGIFLSK